MTVLILSCTAFVLAVGLYLAAMVARTPTPGGETFVDAGARLPGWAMVFAMGGVALSGIDLPGHLALVGRFGLQASHLGVGFVLAALALVLVQKRLWLAARIAGTGSPGDALAAHYGSVTIRIVMLTLAALFALPYAAMLLGRTGTLLSDLTGGNIPRSLAIWGLAFGLFLPAVIGGWRASVLIVAVEALLIVLLLPALAGVSHLVAGGGFPAMPLPVDPGILPDALPGVVQYSAGIGKETAPGGIFTTLAVLSGAVALVGIVLSPGFLYLGMTSRAGGGLGFGAVWVLAGLVAGLLVLLVPILASQLTEGPAALAMRLAGTEQLFAAGLALGLVAPGLLATGFFVTSGTLLVVRELILPFVLPGQSARGNRLTARVALALGFALVASLATFSPLSATVFATLALPLSVQMLPALLGLAFVRWISRSAVICGLIIGGLAVVFTEPPGLILIEGLFLDLPWGRWPLTIHSAGWGLALNVAAVLLVSIFTRAGEERSHRDRLHDEFAARWRTDFGSRGARTAIWSLTIIWAFFALGPGAILGNTFFSQPVFTEAEAALGIPSLWVWQILFWLIGVPLVWWLAYRARLGTTLQERLRPLSGGPARAALRAPAWIAAGLARVTER